MAIIIIIIHHHHHPAIINILWGRGAYKICFEKPTIHRWLFSGGLLCTILSSTIWDYYSPRTPLGQFHQQSCYSATVVITKIWPFCHYCKGNWKGLLLWTEDIKTKRINTETVFLMHWRLLVHSWTAHFIMKMAKMSLQTWCDRLWTLKNGRNHIVTSMYSPLYHTFSIVWIELFPIRQWRLSF